MSGMIGNKNKVYKFNLACCYCGTSTDLNQVAHRDGLGLVIGYLFVCNNCLPIIEGNYRVELKEDKL